MKRILIFSFVLVTIILMNYSVFASSYTESNGTYNGIGINLDVKTVQIVGKLKGKAEFIETNYLLFNLSTAEHMIITDKSYIEYCGKKYYFSGKTLVKDEVEQKGYFKEIDSLRINQDESMKDNTFKIVYFISNDVDFNPVKITKTLIFSQTELSAPFHNGKLGVTELKGKKVKDKYLTEPK